MKIKFIVNPAAGKGKAAKVIDNIKNKLQQSKHSFSIEKTSSAKDAIYMAKKAVAEKYDIVVAVGGDGTIYEVVNGIAGSSIHLGIIPAGTGNDFARTVGIPENVDDALEIILKNNITRIDMGCVNGNYFMNFVSVGFDVQVMKEMEVVKKYVSGTWAYIVSVFKALLNYKGTKVHLLLDNQLIEKEVLLVTAANGKYFGGGMMIAPDADLRDGYFDVCVVNKLSKLRLIRLFPTIFKGTHIREPEVDYYKAKQVEILSDNSFVNCDGEIIGTTPITVKIADFQLNLITHTNNLINNHKSNT